MGEPTCLMQQQPFSYAAGIPNEANEGNPLLALGQSISFGRFMSESLAWEKWSSFSHNRYVEEAERFSRPGSVAQKKAFFEAHYKNLAARKAAAALLEKANAAANDVPELACEGEGQENDTQDSGTGITDCQLGLREQVDVEEINTEPRSVADQNEHNSHIEVDKSESNKEEQAEMATENQVILEEFVKIQSSSQLNVADNKEEAAEVELNGTKLMEKPLLKDFISNRDDLSSTSKKKPVVSSSKSSLIPGRGLTLPCTPAKTATSFRVKKENTATPISKKSAIDFMDKKKSTPKSTHKSMNFTPARELNRITSTIIRKIDNSRVSCSNYKAASKDCSTLLRTPTTLSVLRESKYPLATPESENRRAQTLLHPSASRSKSVRPKWHFLPTDCSKLISACRNKYQSPNLSTPFSFRTEERAARRKERLEEKFNANQAQKVQLQGTLKEKAETELKKLRQSLCFKARPLPDFYKERATPKNQVEKVPLTNPQPPNLGRAPNPIMVPIHSQQPQKYSFKKGGSKHVKGKNSDNSRSFTSRLKINSHENTSPNIHREQPTNIKG